LASVRWQGAGPGLVWMAEDTRILPVAPNPLATPLHFPVNRDGKGSNCPCHREFFSIA
jgi:hypothetical protein